MSDSKGAAIDKVMKTYRNHLIDILVGQKRPKVDPEAEAKQAILALLAQEVKRARIDELEHLASDTKYFKSSGDCTILMSTVKDRIKDLERLG